MKTPPKSSAKVYRDAAKLIETNEEEYCCPALKKRGASIVVREFFRIFAPYPGSYVFWSTNEKEPRVLALLLAAEIVEGGGL